MNKSNLITIGIIAAIVGGFAVMLSIYSRNLDSHPLLACVRADTYTQTIGDQKERGIENFNVSSTPTNVIIDTESETYVSVVGAVDSSTIQEIIDQYNTGTTYEDIVALPTVANASPQGGELSETVIEEYRASVYSRGARDGRFIYVEYADFGCPACQAQSARGTVDQVIAANANEVQFVFQNFVLPVSANSQNAAESVLCTYEQLGSDAFFAIKPEIFALDVINQQNIVAIYDRITTIDTE